MAAAPPPYSQRDALRAQRYYRRALRPPSLVGPLLLIVVGVVALLVETDHLSAYRLWDWYIHWWPLLLVGVGLLSLGEWWLDRRHMDPARRWHGGSHAGWIVLILLLAAVGYMVTTSRGWRGVHVFGQGFEDEDFFGHLLGQEHDADRSLNRAIPAGATVKIQVPHGDVTVTASGDDQVHVQAHLMVYAANDRSARRSLDALAPDLVVDGETVTLRSGGSDSGRADLTIEIPKGNKATIDAGHGDVTLEGLTGETTVNAGRGDVKADNLAGVLQVRMGKGDLEAHAVSGGVTLQGKFDDVTVSDVQGRVALDGDFFGNTSVAHVTAPVHFHSSRTDVETIGIDGALTIDSGDLELNDAAGPVRITTSAKDVECTGIRGDVRVEDGDGDISVGLAVPLGDTNIHNRNGAISLSVPHGAGFELQASAKNGDIDTKLDLPLKSAGDGHSISGTVAGGGPRIQLSADHGDIEIQTVDIEPPSPPEPPAPPSPPSPPAPPAPPGKGTRHFHASRDNQPVEQ